MKINDQLSGDNQILRKSTKIDLLRNIEPKNKPFGYQRLFSDKEKWKILSVLVKKTTKELKEIFRGHRGRGRVAEAEA